jgi:hypothetical protein
VDRAFRIEQPQIEDVNPLCPAYSFQGTFVKCKQGSQFVMRDVWRQTHMHVRIMLSTFYEE